jgi:hypothetical protein
MALAFVDWIGSVAYATTTSAEAPAAMDPDQTVRETSRPSSPSARIARLPESGWAVVLATVTTRVVAEEYNPGASAPHEGASGGSLAPWLHVVSEIHSAELVAEPSAPTPPATSTRPVAVAVAVCA